MKEEHKSKEKVGFSSLVGLHLEAYRSSAGLTLFVSGVIGIGDFTQEYVLLRSHGGRVEISGKRMSVHVYENKTVEIIGKIERIGFGYGKDR